MGRMPVGGTVAAGNQKPRVGKLKQIINYAIRELLGYTKNLTAF